MEVKKGTTEEPLYIQVGRSALTSALIVNDNRLWISCGNMIHILNAVTLDTLEKVPISTSQSDYVQTMVLGDEGVWLTLNGSSVVELWDKSEITCRLLFDVARGHSISHKKEEDAINQRRVTCLLPFGSDLWIGRGDGTLQIFEVSSSYAASSKQSPHRADLSRIKHSGRETDSSSDTTSCVKSNSKNTENKSTAINSEQQTSSTAAEQVPSVTARRRYSRQDSLTNPDHRRSSSEPFNRMPLTPMIDSSHYPCRGVNGDMIDGDETPPRRRPTLRYAIAGGRLRSCRKGSLHGLVYPVTLKLQAKVKVSEKPVRCLVQQLQRSCSEQDSSVVVVSCSGYYGDDEAVLTWKRLSLIHI